MQRGKLSFDVPDHLAFLIDECLSPDLCEVARNRGHHALHTVWVKLRSKKDPTVASYALEKDMVLVTNNLVDFKKIYKRKTLHPGIIFLSADDELMDRESQVLMFEHALDSVEQNEPINEAISIRLSLDHENNLVVDIERYELPKALAKSLRSSASRFFR